MPCSGLNGPFHRWDGLAQRWDGLAQRWGELAQRWGGLAQRWGGLAQRWGGHFRARKQSSASSRAQVVERKQSSAEAQSPRGNLGPAARTSKVLCLVWSWRAPDRFFAEDGQLGSTLAMAPTRLRRVSAARRSDAGLRGRLEQFGLATVLSFLDLERRSGQVLVVAGNKIGRVSLRGGQVISARIEGSRRVNRAAVYELLSWQRGSFAFTQEELPATVDEIGAPTTLLLMEAALRADEAVEPVYPLSALEPAMPE